MNKKDFKACMQQGRGGCVLALKSEKNIEKYKDIVLWGCLHNLSYDTQCEGVRAEYVYHLTTFFCDEAYFVVPIIKAFASLPNRENDLFQHLSKLLSLFAKSGDEDAQLAIMQKYDALYSILLNKCTFDDYDFERDNFELLCIALRHFGDTDNKFKIVCDLGQLIRENSHYDCDCFDWFCFCLENDFGKDGLQTFLSENSQKSDAIKCFYESYLQLKVKKEKAQRKRPPKTVVVSSVEKIKNAKKAKRKRPPKPVVVPSVEKIKNEVASTGRVAPLTKVRFSRLAEYDAKKELAENAVAEVDLDKKAELLSPLFHDSFPLPHEIIIEYTKSEHERLQEVSLGILTNCQSGIVRDYAFSLLQAKKHKAHALRMLLCNYTPEDKQFLLDELNALKVTYRDECDWHTIGFTILDLCAKDKELPKEFLFYIYNTTLCSCCRYAAIRELDKRQWLTPDIIEECRYDSNKNITEYINQNYPV